MREREREREEGGRETCSCAISLSIFSTSSFITLPWCSLSLSLCSLALMYSAWIRGAPGFRGQGVPVLRGYLVLEGTRCFLVCENTCSEGFVFSLPTPCFSSSSLRASLSCRIRPTLSWIFSSPTPPSGGEKHTSQPLIQPLPASHSASHAAFSLLASR